MLGTVRTCMRGAPDGRAQSNGCTRCQEIDPKQSVYDADVVHRIRFAGTRITGEQARRCRSSGSRRERACRGVRNRRSWGISTRQSGDGMSLGPGGSLRRPSSRNSEGSCSRNSREEEGSMKNEGGSAEWGTVSGDRHGVGTSIHRMSPGSPGPRMDFVLCLSGGRLQHESESTTL